MDKQERPPGSLVRVLEVDQFSSTGEIFCLDKIQPAARARDGSLGRPVIREVWENQNPPWAHVWYRNDGDGKFVLWKENYDSSG